MSKTEDILLIKEQLRNYIVLLDRAGQMIVDEGISKYPIMVVHKQEIQLGVPLEIRQKLPGDWLINASTLEEFVSKGIVDPIKVDEFRQLYKQHEHHVCLLLLSELGAQFVFFEKKEE